MLLFNISAYPAVHSLMVLRFRTTEPARTRVELHTPVVNHNSRVHPYAIQTSRPPRLVYPNENREEIIIGIELYLQGANVTISPRYQDLEREMAQFMPDARSIEHVDLNSALEIHYAGTANVTIAGYQPVRCLVLNFDRRGNGIPSELDTIYAR
jgi:hypothetical protein